MNVRRWGRGTDLDGLCPSCPRIAFPLAVLPPIKSLHKDGRPGQDDQLRKTDWVERQGLRKKTKPREGPFLQLPQEIRTLVVPGVKIVLLSPYHYVQQIRSLKSDMYSTHIHI